MPARYSLRPNSTRSRVFVRRSAKLERLTGAMSDLEDLTVETESLFAEAIREHLDLKARNSEIGRAHV